MACRIACCFVVVPLLLAVCALAQDGSEKESPPAAASKSVEQGDAKDDSSADKPSAPKAKAKPAETGVEDLSDASPGEIQMAYEEVLARWKDGLKELRTLQVKYQQASEDERLELSEKFSELREQLRREVEPVLIARAKQAYLADSEKNADLAGFLAMVAQEHIYNDRFDQAWELCEMLFERNAGIKQLDLFAGIAAFATHRFAEAKKHFQRASEAGLFEVPKQATKFRKDMVNLAKRYHQAIVAQKYPQLWEQEQKLRAAEAKADDLPRVKLETTVGDFVLELFENEAPNTVANFVYLVENNFYDGVEFHRVIPNFMAQTGDPSGTGRGGPGYLIKCECYQPNHRKHFRGSVSMAKSDRPHTGGSQFFLTFLPTPHLNGEHTVFGRVIEGIELLPEIARVDPKQPDPNTQPDKIIEATVLRKRDHIYKPRTNPPLPE